MKPLFACMLCPCLLALCACGQAEPEPITVPTTAVSTTQAPATQLIEYPASYKDAPEAYKPVLDDLYVLNQLYNPDNGYAFTSGLPYQEAIVGAWLYGPIAYYAVADINSDGIPELILYQETADDMYLRALFTLKDGEPFCIESFPGRIRRFAADGTMYYVHETDRTCELHSSILEAGATKFTPLIMYGNYWSKCFKVFGNNWADEVFITQEKFNAALEMHRNPPNPMPLTFIPIEQ